MEIDNINIMHAQEKEKKNFSNYIDDNLNCFIFVEEDFYDIKHNPNKVWEKYEERILKLCKNLAYNKAYNYEDLFQQSYIFYRQLAKKYDPYYAGNFYPFDRFLLRNLITKLRAYIQDYYYKHNREKPAEIFDYKVSSEDNDLDKVFVEYLYSLLPEKHKDILIMTEMEGYSQQEVGEKIGVSQSRISVIKKSIVKTLKDKVKEEDR